MAEMTIEQQRALAMASARLRLQNQPAKPAAPEPAFEREAREIIQTTPAELISANPIIRALTSAARPIMGAADILTGGGNQERIKQLDEMQRRGAKALGYGGVETGAADLSGALLSPVTALAARAPAVAGYVPRIAQSAEIGGIAGLTSGAPDPLAAGAAGTAVGGAIPAVAAPIATAGKAGYRALVEPLTSPAAIKGRAFLEAAGDKADEIIALLRQNKKIVPGSAPTAGEAAVPAGRAEFSALQKSAEQAAPSQYLARADAQNAARLAQVRSVGQTPAALEAAEAARKAAADPLYAAARAGGGVADTGQALARINDTLARNPGNRELVTELRNIKGGLLDAKGQSRVNAEEVASVIDGIKAAVAKEDNKFIGGALRSLQRDLEASIPGYQRAQQVFAEKSAPVNQMQVGQFLEGKLVPALADDAKQKAAAYAGALRDAPGTIKRATGAPRFKELSEALTPQQLAAVNSVRDDLARGARSEAMAKAGRGSQNAAEVASASMEGTLGGKVRLGILDRTAMVMNSIVARAEGKINKKLAAEIAAEMLNPPVVGESLAKAAERAKRNQFMADRAQKIYRQALAVGVQEGQR